MKILQANKAYYPHVGGVETVVQQLAEGFAATPGVTSRVLACADEPRTTHRTRCGVDVTQTASLGRLASLPLSPSFIARMEWEDADILQLHEPALLPAASYLWSGSSRRRFKKLVVWWHSDIVGQARLRRIYEPLQRRLLAAADAVIASSPNLINQSVMLSPVKDKCRVVHIGIDPGRFADTEQVLEKAAAIRKRYQGRPIVLFIGRLVAYKGVEYLVDAMRGLPDVQLIVAGTGKLRTKVEALAAQCPGNVDLMGYILDDDMPALFKACDIFALPSVLPSEAFGIVQVEAMANGKPVITADLETGVTYVNQHERTGLVVPRRDSSALAAAIRTLVDDDALRRRLGEYARERVLREFTVESMVRDTLAIYRELLRV